MGAIVGISGMTGGYVGSTPVSAVYVGSTQIWAASSGGSEYTDVAAIIASTTGNCTPANSVVNIELPVTADTDNIKVRVKGYIPNLGAAVSTGSTAVNANTGSPTFRCRILPSRCAFHVGSKPFAGLWEYTVGDAFDVTCENNMNSGEATIYDNLQEASLLLQTAYSCASDLPFYIMLDTVPVAEVQIWKDSVLVFDGRAVERNSDGQVGIYDEVSDAFYTSNESIEEYIPSN